MAVAQEVCRSVRIKISVVVCDVMQFCRQALMFLNSLLPPSLDYLLNKPLYVIFTGLTYPNNSR